MSNSYATIRFVGVHVRLISGNKPDQILSQDFRFVPEFKYNDMAFIFWEYRQN